MEKVIEDLIPKHSLVTVVELKTPKNKADILPLAKYFELRKMHRGVMYYSAFTLTLDQMRDPSRISWVTCFAYRNLLAGIEFYSRNTKATHPPDPES